MGGREGGREGGKERREGGIKGEYSLCLFVCLFVFVALQLSESVDCGVARQALGALLNLAVSEELRGEIGERGGVKSLLCECVYMQSTK